MTADAVPSVPTIDLHAHTTASDGLLTPAELIAEASARGLSVLGVTDHDTIDGLREAIAAGASLGVTIVPGVELSTEIDGRETHILGYYVNPEDGAFVAKLADLAAGRVRRIVRMVERLQELGYAIDLAPILVQAETGSIGRPHVARALVAIGAVGGVSEAFDRFLKPGKPGWVPRERFTPEDAVAMILANGAIPVLAHPFTTGDVAHALDRLIPAGLVGMEVFYGEYSPEQRAALLAIARDRGLLATGGSDYHGPAFKEGRDLGSVEIPAWVFDDLRACHQQER